jgi:hypothetical protein
MPKEPIENLTFRCEEHAPKPGKYAKELPETFVGKFVKVGFPGIRPDNGKETIEHMWVKITGVTKNGRLRGELNNVPLTQMPYEVGSTVFLAVDEIEEVLADA